MAEIDVEEFMFSFLFCMVMLVVTTILYAAAYVVGGIAGIVLLTLMFAVSGTVSFYIASDETLNW